MEVDNHSALDVGCLKRGTRTFEVRRPKFEDAESRRSWLPESVHQCRSHCGGQVGTTFVACVLILGQKKNQP